MPGLKGKRIVDTGEAVGIGSAITRRRRGVLQQKPPQQKKQGR